MPTVSRPNKEINHVHSKYEPPLCIWRLRVPTALSPYGPLTLTTISCSLQLCYYPLTDGETGLKIMPWTVDIQIEGTRDCLTNRWVKNPGQIFNDRNLGKQQGTVGRTVTAAQKVGDSVIQRTAWFLWVSACSPKQMRILSLPIMGLLRWSHKMRFMKGLLPISTCSADRFTSLTMVESEGGGFMSIFAIWTPLQMP